MTEIKPRTEIGSNLTVRRASMEDASSVWEIIKADSDWLTNIKNLDHWTKYYTREKVEKKIKSQEVYLVHQNGSEVGTISLDTNPVEYYRQEEEMSKFAEPNKPALYVTSLAVTPENQGQGIASKLMVFADSVAKKKGIEYVRFDCRAKYTDLVNFYKKRGYQEVGQTLDEDDNNEVYLLMEKKI